MKIGAFIVLVLMLVTLVTYASAIEDISQLKTDESRQKWVDNLKNKGCSTEEIAEKIILQISLSQNSDYIPNSFEDKQNITDQKIQHILNAIDLIEVDDDLQLEVPYYWVILIADDKQKQIFLSEIEKSELLDRDKIELKAKLLEIWKKYPMKYEKIGRTTYISPKMENKAIALTKSENLTLNQMDMIHSFKGDGIMPTPKWSVNPTHYDLVYYASLNSGYPDPTIAAESSGYPDEIYGWDPPVMWYNPDLGIGGAPTHAQEDFVYARNFYQLGYIFNASKHVGYSSHYLTDVGNPLHTGRERDQVFDKIFHPSGDDVHTLYEVYVASYWENDFKSWVMGNQYSYKWNWDGADESTKAVATSSHRFVDTLYTKIYRNRQGFWNEDDWTREITRVCLMTSSQYTNGLINAVMLKPFPGHTELPTDYDSDRDIEDLNGNQGIDFDDVILYFNYLEWIETNEPIVPFDYNNNGRIEFDDLYILYSEV